MAVADETARRRTFAIISHPDAGKTTLTEKLLLLGGAIQLAGTVKGRKSARYATSDWMELEKQRGISVTSSVMQFQYNDHIVNLLDTPGHADFSEDTYRTLTAVDSALMVIDSVKGVEDMTRKLLEVCRLRETPVFTFMNKLDREGRDPVELMDEVESVLQIRTAPVTWPIGRGRRFCGIYDLRHDVARIFGSAQGSRNAQDTVINGLDNPMLDELIGGLADEVREEVELVREAGYRFDMDEYLAGRLTPVHFGSAINGFGVEHLLNDFVTHAPGPRRMPTEQRTVDPYESRFSGFVFKIQANMDPAHRDRIAFLRVCSGRYQKGMRLKHVRIGRQVQISNILTFKADEREQTETAYPGDIIGLHNHGTIRVGDTFTEGEALHFTGIPNFAPELFRRAVLKDALRSKALQKGLMQLCEEGATQLFRPVDRNDLILGAVGALQFEVVAHRLRHEYGVQCDFESVPVSTVRWVHCADPKRFEEFRKRASENLATDAAGELVYMAPNRVNLDLTMERWPEITFSATREHGGSVSTD